MYSWFSVENISTKLTLRHPDCLNQDFRVKYQPREKNKQGCPHP